jgi:hypothetical protein
MPENFIFMGVYFVVSKLYAISLMAALNTRSIVGGRGTDDQNESPAEHRGYGVHQKLGSAGSRQLLMAMDMRQSSLVSRSD